jgi:glycosyltransferase involved in cell wall biosynthesis
VKVSAIVPAYNAESHLARAVASLFSTRHDSLEVVIVDDGSSDGTWLLAQQLASEHPARIVPLQHPGNARRGAAASRNLAIARSTGELICFLDADDFVYPHRFDVSLPLLEERKDVDAVYELCRVVLGPGAAQEGPLWRENLNFGIDVACEGEPLRAKLLGGSVWATSAIVLRRHLLQTVGPFPEGVRYAEDLDLWLRMACIGHIVPGEMTSPVSAYWRHRENTFVPAPERKADVLRAINRTRRWARSQSVPDPIRLELQEGARRYLHRGLVTLRESGERLLAWKLLWEAANGGGVKTILTNEIVRQVSWLGIETLVRRPRREAIRARLRR